MTSFTHNILTPHELERPELHQAIKSYESLVQNMNLWVRVTTGELFKNLQPVKNESGEYTGGWRQFDRNQEYEWYTRKEVAIPVSAVTRLNETAQNHDIGPQSISEMYPGRKAFEKIIGYSVNTKDESFNVRFYKGKTIDGILVPNEYWLLKNIVLTTPIR